MEFQKVISGAFYYVLKYKLQLAKALAVPFVAFLAIDAIYVPELNDLASWVLGFLSILLQSLIAITTHRIVLLGPASVPTWGIRSFSKREFFFVLHVFGLTAVTIPVALIGVTSVVGLVAAVILMCWLVGRLSLVFPGIATDKGVTFKVSWKLTQNYQGLMSMVVVLFPLMLSIPSLLLQLLPHSRIIGTFIESFATVFQVAALSMAYHLITDQIYGKG